MARQRRRGGPGSPGPKGEWGAVAKHVRTRAERTARIDRELHAAVLRLAGPVDGKSALELGCGRGALVRVLASRGAFATGVDISPRAIREAERDARDNDVDPRPRFVTGDAEHGRSLPRASFDLVIAADLLVSLKEPRRAIRNAARRLLPHGRLVITTAHPQNASRARVLEPLFSDLRAARLRVVDLVELGDPPDRIVLLAERAIPREPSKPKPTG